MAIKLEEARLKHGIHEAIALRGALEAIADKKRRKALQRLVTESDWGAFKATSFSALDLFTDAMPARRLGSLYSESFSLPLDATAVPLNSSLRIHRTTYSQPATEEARKLHALANRIDEWNLEVDRRLENIKRDKELSDRVRKHIEREMLEHSNRINILAQKIGEEKMAVVQKAALDAERARNTPQQRRMAAALKRKDAKFNRVLSELERAPLKGKNDPRTLEYAKKLFKAHPLRMLEVKAEIELMPTATTLLEADEDEADELIDRQELRDRTLAWNIGNIFENEEFRKFVEKERAEAMRKWEIEPFPEGNRIWRDAGLALRQHRERLKSLGLSEDEFNRKFNEIHQQLTVSVTDSINEMLRKQGKRLVLFDRAMFKLPAHLERKIKSEMPPVFRFPLAERKAERKTTYHA